MNDCMPIENLHWHPKQPRNYSVLKLSSSQRSTESFLEANAVNSARQEDCSRTLTPVMRTKRRDLWLQDSRFPMAKSTAKNQSVPRESENCEVVRTVEPYWQLSECIAHHYDLNHCYHPVDVSEGPKILVPRNSKDVRCKQTPIYRIDD